MESNIIDNFQKRLTYIDSPKIKIKSTIFNDSDTKKDNCTKSNSNKDLELYRRAVTQKYYLFNQIGYIKRNNKLESKRAEEFAKNMKKNRKASTPDARSVVVGMLLNNNINTNYLSNNKNVENMNEGNNNDRSEIQRKYSVNLKRKKRLYLNKKSKQQRPSLSFGDVEEEDNEEYSNDNDNNNNDSSYISKIESKYVSMYDIDEDLKELKEIGNNLKSPVNAAISKNNNRLISSFSINNNDNNNNNNYNDNNNNINILNENDNNDNCTQNSILFQ
jgi:hypothetical protein